jgi:hypothetical protein
MMRQISIGLCLALLSAAIPSRAANRPHAGKDRETKVVWTNDDLDKLHDLGLISVVGREDDEPARAPAPRQYARAQDPEWYAEQAGKLRDELGYRRAQLREYQQALDDARNLRESAGGIDLVGEDFAITPEAGIEILEQRVNEAQTELEALEDLARRNDIAPGTLRGQ